MTLTFSVDIICCRPPWEEVFEEYHNCDKPFDIVHKYMFKMQLGTFKFCISLGMAVVLREISARRH